MNEEGNKKVLTSYVSSGFACIVTPDEAQGTRRAPSLSVLPSPEILLVYAAVTPD